MAEMSSRQARRWIRLLGACFLFYIFQFVFRFRFVRDEFASYARKPSRGRVHPDHHHSRKDFNSLNLGEAQCRRMFPGLMKEIDDQVALGPFTIKEARNMGPLQARLKDGELYIIHWEDEDVVVPGIMSTRLSALHQIHRAIITSPISLPDTVFSLNCPDEPLDRAWNYGRPAYDVPTPGNPPVNRPFLMPHFSWWAWPMSFIDGFPSAAAAVDTLESSMTFAEKDPRAVWRGTPRYNTAHNPHLRENLVRMANNTDWADVQELRWEDYGRGSRDGKAKGFDVSLNALRIEEFCKYRYVIHTEGITYSGRFQFLQMCRSVLLTPPIAWMQHTTHLVKPLFTSDLRLKRSGKGIDAPWEPIEGVKKAWPIHYKPEEANIVFVSPDWTDLEATVEWMEDHPEIAEGIAQRQREFFVEQGYFSPAAEACYWRALILGWSKVVRLESQGWEKKKGMRWELFAIHE